MRRTLFPPQYAFLLDHPLRLRLTPLKSRLEQLGIKPGMQVLDVGCGTGFLLPTLLELLGPTGHVTGVDLQPALLERAREKAGDDPRVTLRQASASDTGFPEGHFDAVLLHHVFVALSDRAGAVREMRRVLKVGGVLGIWEPRFLVNPWRLDAMEGMFWGQRFVLEARFSSMLGYGRRFRAVDDAPGSRLRPTPPA